MDDDFLNCPCYLRPGHTSDFRRQAALGGILPTNKSSRGDGYHNYWSERQQGIKCDGSTEARCIVVDPFARCLPGHSRQHLEQKP